MKTMQRIFLLFMMCAFILSCASCELIDEIEREFGPPRSGFGGGGGGGGIGGGGGAPANNGGAPANNGGAPANNGGAPADNGGAGSLGKHQHNITFSAPIGEINGTIYCARSTSYYESDGNLYPEKNVPTTVLLPVQTKIDCIVTEFAYYDGFVYYVESEGGTSDFSTWLYRCRPDWSGKELLLEQISGAGDVFEGERSFVIDNGILYMGYIGYNSEVVTIDLSNLQHGKGYMPVYEVNDNGSMYDTRNDNNYNIVIFNDKIFFTDNQKRLYIAENGYNKLLAVNAYLDGGLAGDYLYYAEYDYKTDPTAKLKRISLTTGQTEFIDSRMPAGGGGPYFCY